MSSRSLRNSEAKVGTNICSMSGKLDDLETIRKCDKQGMLGILNSFDRQLEEALEIGLQADISSQRTVGTVLVCGMGGSAMAGDFLRAYLGTDLKVPLFVNRNYSIPGFADENTLALICSYSGNSEETLSAFHEARRMGCHIICLGSNGELQSYSNEYGYPFLQIPGGSPPRTALGYLAIPLLIVLARLSLISDRSEEIGRSVSWVKSRIELYGLEAPEEGNAAKGLALQVHQKIPVVYGSEGRLEIVAKRWRSQFCENGKQLAYSSALPEMNHNEIAGWKHPAPALQQLFPIFLRDREDHPQIQARTEMTCRLVAEKAGAFLEFWSEGESWLERLWTLILLGDYASLYLACLNRENPTPMQVAEDLKIRLRQQGAKDNQGGDQNQSRDLSRV